MVAGVSLSQLPERRCITRSLRYAHWLIFLVPGRPFPPPSPSPRQLAPRFIRSKRRPRSPPVSEFESRPPSSLFAPSITAAEACQIQIGKLSFDDLIWHVVLLGLVNQQALSKGKPMLR